MADPETTSFPARVYPSAVTLVRRSARGPGLAPPGTNVDDVERWLLEDAGREPDLLFLLEDLVWRLVAAGLPLDRLSLHMGTLHPQLIGFAWNWARADGLCDEVHVANDSLETDAFRRNPLWTVFTEGVVVRCNPQDPADRARYPLMNDLAAAGFTDYVAVPLSGGTSRNAITVGTRQPGGFTEDDRLQMRRLLRLFALHVQRHAAMRISDNALGAYLGGHAATKVLAGSIKRGAGESLHAVIWMADLRGFTDLSDRLGAQTLLALLNGYFDAMAGAVLAHGGEVLKFIGDGVLAVFPPGETGDLAEAARRALAAAEAAVAALAAFNEAPPPELAAVDGWQPLRAGIALHEGEVFFGNIGAPQRLDFTVIGPAVNETSRVESLQKQLKRPILLTEAVARHLDGPLEAHGAHALRGVATPLAIFSPA
jgi:adenylate cyclase